jgi:hypothetical protein
VRVNWHFDDLKIDLHVADTDHNRIKEFTNSGTFSKPGVHMGLLNTDCTITHSFNIIICDHHILLL